MCWEALNNIADADRPVVIVVNDNGRSYSPTTGDFANYLARLRLKPGYERMLRTVRDALERTPVVGPPLYEALHGVKRGVKDLVAPQGMFEDLGLKYIGPIDGHDVTAVEHALRRARGYGRPVIVHAITRKGLGHAPAENDTADHFHAIGAVDPDTGTPRAEAGASWKRVFSDTMVEIGAQRRDVVGITAAMLQPVGLDAFARAYPGRVFDVGIAEQHAATSAAGMALGGLHPVVAVYATFLNRAFDQVLMDVALHRAGVTFVLDRAGVTGEDGASHHGMWDLSILQVVPGLRLAAPRDAATLRDELREALDVADAPTVLPDIAAVERLGGMDVLVRSGDADVLVVSVGAMAETCVEIAGRLTHQGVGVTVVDPRWVKPVDEHLPVLARAHRLVVVVEDNSRAGGVGAAVTQALQDARVPTPVRTFGIPEEFLPHGRRAQVLADIGLTAQDVSRAVIEVMARVDAEPAPVDTQR
jgi:1-deoxy-D-xylulose-5-phosphate synthase